MIATPRYLRVTTDSVGNVVPEESCPDRVSVGDTTVNVTEAVALMNAPEIPWGALNALSARQIHALAASTSSFARNNSMDPTEPLQGAVDGELVAAVRYLDTAARIAHGDRDRPNPHLGNVVGGVVLVLRKLINLPSYSVPTIKWGRVELEIRLARTYSAIRES